MRRMIKGSTRGTMVRGMTSATTVIGSLAVAGCDSRPDEAIDGAREAFAVVDAAGAAEYAPEAMSRLAGIETRLAAELEVQDERFGVFRRYDRAARLADSLQTAAASTNEQVAIAREQVRLETEALIERTRVALEETMVLWTTAPIGEGSAADRVALRGDLDGASALLEEAQAALSNGRYVEAKSKTTLALETTQRVRTALDNPVFIF